MQEDLHGIAAHLRRTRDLGQKLAVRAVEPRVAVRLSLELVALLVNSAVMPATEQSRRCRRSAPRRRPACPRRCAGGSDSSCSRAGGLQTEPAQPPSCYSTGL